MTRARTASETDETLLETPGAGIERLSLLVVGERVFKTHPLPSSGEVLVGRTASADIEIDDPSISRTHARLRLGPPLQLIDLRSANGTFVHDKRIAPERPVPIAINEAFRIGTITAIVQRRTLVHGGRQVHDHAYFETRIEEECARMRRGNGTFGVIHIVSPSESADAARSVIAAQLRDADVVATYAPGEIELLVVDATATTTVHVERRIRDALTARSIRADVGTAQYPNDGRGATALLAAARTRARGVGESHARDVVIEDEQMRSLYSLVERVATADISVLLLGETGVGKEVVAGTIDRMSSRSAQPFMRLNCAALSETLLESELFGHERGAFTGATQTKPGLLEAADGGVVFLDEVGELEPATQVKLLRVLDERKVMRVGAVKPRSIDVRLISATNRDLEHEVERGHFRLDLFYRLNAMAIVIPPLRERVPEIVPLARSFIAMFAKTSRQRPPRLTPAAIAELEAYRWPGNVRELRNVIERALVLRHGDELDARDLPLDRMRQLFAPHPTPTAPAGQRDAIVAALDSCGGNQTQAAKVLGVSRRTLVTWLERHNIPRPRKR